jgi:hypothetical protein
MNTSRRYSPEVRERAVRMVLEFKVKNNKVDHTSQSSKDISDALAGVVFGLSRRRVVWARWGVNPCREARNLTKTTLESHTPPEDAVKFHYFSE